ncbi:MAG: POTRA domain-containing protein, partial [Woeseiaceae bacterium]|nr:POTRA domain-containing protein [Woeseiaceae bacterium]
MASWQRLLLLTLACLIWPATGYADLQIEGVDDDLARNIRSYVTLTTEPCDAEPWRVRRRFRNIETEARSALEPYGYYSPVIAATL